MAMLTQVLVRVKQAMFGSIVYWNASLNVLMQMDKKIKEIPMVFAYVKMGLRLTLSKTSAIEYARIFLMQKDLSDQLSHLATVILGTNGMMDQQHATLHVMEISILHWLMVTQSVHVLRMLCITLIWTFVNWFAHLILCQQLMTL